MALSTFLASGDPFGDIFDPFRMVAFRPDTGDQTGSKLSDDARAIANTKVDWIEKPDKHVIKVDLPGVAKNDITVTVEDNNTLVISGERVKEDRQDDDRVHRYERVVGRFLRRFRLPDNADVSKITAKMDQGVLNIEIPKKEKKEEKRNVQIDYGNK